ncbi:MAG: hypothetical protein M0Z27_12240 [Thermaerobacter sp.]|nr:hypothetical protein [Thermaerobacter sp.]
MILFFLLLCGALIWVLAGIRREGHSGLPDDLAVGSVSSAAAAVLLAALRPVSLADLGQLLAFLVAVVLCGVLAATAVHRWFVHPGRSRVGEWVHHGRN